MSEINKITCTLPFCAEKNLPQSQLSLTLRIVAVVFGVFTLALGCFLCGTMGLNSLGATVGYSMLSAGALLLLVSASVKCVKQRVEEATLHPIEESTQLSDQRAFSVASPQLEITSETNDIPSGPVNEHLTSGSLSEISAEGSETGATSEANDIPRGPFFDTYPRKEFMVHQARVKSVKFNGGLITSSAINGEVFKWPEEDEYCHVDLAPFLRVKNIMPGFSCNRLHAVEGELTIVVDQSNVFVNPPRRRDFLLSVFVGENEKPEHIALHGNHFAVGSGGKSAKIEIWSWKNRECLHKINLDADIKQMIMKEHILACAFNGDDGDECVSIFSLESGEQLYSFTAKSVAIDKNVVVCASDVHFVIWSLETGECLKEFQYGISGLKLRLASLYENMMVILPEAKFNTETRRTINEIYLLSTQNGMILQTLELDSNHFVHDMQFDGDQLKLCTTSQDPFQRSSDREIKLWIFNRAQERSTGV